MEWLTTSSWHFLIEKMLATCRRGPVKEEFNLYVDNFPYLSPKMVDHGGHWDDIFPDEVGILSDRSTSGEIDKRNVIPTQ